MLSKMALPRELDVVIAINRQNLLVVENEPQRGPTHSCVSLTPFYVDTALKARGLRLRRKINAQSLLTTKGQALTPRASKIPNKSGDSVVGLADLCDWVTHGSK